MSMNLHLSGEREVTVNKTGKQSKQTVSFDLYQTPTAVTRAAMASGDPKGEYIKYVMGFSKDEQIARYAEDDIFDERDPIGFDTYNSAIEHLGQLADFLAMCEEEGYEVEFFEM